MIDDDGHEAQRRLRGRNLAVLVALLAFVVLFYLVSIVKMMDQ
ncbi:MAG: hypothetical protein V3R98_00850 [Alphaproteobacteria bacterium]